MAVRTYGQYKVFQSICELCQCDLDLEDMALAQGHDTPLGHGNNCVKYYADPTRQRGVKARTQILGMCAL